VNVPPGFSAVRIEATSLKERRVTLRAGASLLSQLDVHGGFTIEANLPPGGAMIELLVDRPLDPDDDPRELGVAVGRVAVRDDRGWVDLDMARDIESVVKEAAPREWVESLLSITEERDPEVDALFCDVRGPHSKAMRAWLEEHAGDYDLVLAQGVPFAPMAWASPIARQRVPVVLLPHFHLEDRYYHWRSFYEAFRNADCVLSAPPQLKEQFFDKLDVVAECVAGGGIDLDEFRPQVLESSRLAFRSVHTSARPFVLVLGRKAAGKRYEIVLEAARAVDANEPPFDVVMVGPDEDGKEIAQPHVYCYGSRLRDFVLGALAECACLANMSESESFGIVLLEAWAARRPVVAQRDSLAFSDLVEHGTNGYLASSEVEVRERVAAYIADPILAAMHGEAGHALAQRYSWSALSETVHGILMEIS
jgi:glycosyltransferase involved in cell wall biosynthesis